MQIINLSPTMMVILCFILWPIFQVSAAGFCLFLPDKMLSPDSRFFRTHKFENNGKIYAKIFAVDKWKHLLPDGAAVYKKRGFRKKHIKNFTELNLNKFLRESVRAELSHWLAIIPFWIFGFFTPFFVIWIMLLYALAVNLPCIIAQRYNRPRVKKLIKKIQLSKKAAS